MYGFLADMVMLLHFGFILLAVFGGLLALCWRRFALIHLPVLLWALYIEFKPGTLCPLTPLEQTLRHRAGETSYTAGFIDHYLAPIIYPTNLTTRDQYFMGVALLLFTGIIYWRVSKRWRSARR